MTKLAEKNLQKGPTDVAVSTSAITLTPGTSRYFVVDVDANVTTVNITTPDGACDFMVLLQFAGSYSVEGFPAAVKWGVGDNAPPFSGTSGQEVLVVLTYLDSTDGYRADASAAYAPVSE